MGIHPVPASSSLPESTDDSHYALLGEIERNPRASQRDLANALGVSLGKLNYCLRALIDKGWVKARNFRDSKHKLGYAYLLTPHGIESKAQLTVNFLRRKIAEYDALGEEIARLKREVESLEKDPKP